MTEFENQDMNEANCENKVETSNVNCETDVNCEIEPSEEKHILRVITSETILRNMKNLIQDAKEKLPSSKVNRNFIRSLKQCQADIAKYVKKAESKKVRSKRSSTEGGFQVKYPTTEEFSSFAKSQEPMSRIDITKVVCKYIRDNGLNTHSLSKTLIIPDEKLRTLLQCDQETLKFTDIQKLIGRFQVKA
jgi:hypothetical protein